MHVTLFEQLGKYGGVGGISLGVFMLVVLAVIKVSRKPLPESSIRLFRLVVVLAWCIGLAGIFVWATTSKDNKRVDTKNGIAAGGNIVDSELVVTTKPSRQFQNLSSRESCPKTDSGVSTEGGVAAGGDIQNSKIRVHGMQGK